MRQTVYRLLFCIGKNNFQSVSIVTKCFILHNYYTCYLKNQGDDRVV